MGRFYLILFPKNFSAFWKILLPVVEICLLIRTLWLQCRELNKQDRVDAIDQLGRIGNFYKGNKDNLD